jgi:hypothetical protein
MGRRISQAIDQWPPYRPVIRLNWPRVGFTLVAATVYSAALVALGFFAATSEHRTPEGVASSPPAAAEVSSAPNADSSSPLQLLAEPATQVTDDRLPLGIVVRGPSELASAAAVEILGVPSGWALSAGRPLGNRWRIPAAKLSGAAIFPPRRFSGAVDLQVELRLADDTLVERRPVRRAVTDPNLAVEKLAAEDTSLLLTRAEGLLVLGDFSAARLVLKRAAENGDARAALLLGGTYEGCLQGWQTCNITEPDRAAARSWYEMAAKLGSSEARRRLDRLASE